ncbi:MAG: UDP-N-acetylmuramoyl-L-alanine--D-glutamate ligase [Lachnospiraceae bacterium]|nr:UDP-N-acetylmuramoyl-L-alanine--D-glutamate ligase [Lachnospiraceae bacterium]
MNFKGLKVLVVGTGISGIGAVKLLEEKEAVPILFDSNDKIVVDEVREKLLDGGKTSVYVGTLPDNVLKSIDMVILSPGVPVDIPLVKNFKDRGIKIWGEVELGFEFAKGDLLAVTGTNGKTTTTTLLGEIIKNHHGEDDVFVVGNIGNPYTLEALNTRDTSVTVAEISSFQLETIDKFRPKVSAILNITPDHLNRHITMENYVAVKEDIARNQTEEDCIVLNYDDEYTRSFADKVKAKVVFFTRKENPSTVNTGDLLYMDGDNIMYNDETVINVRDMILIGTHNYENVMAASGMALSYGVPMETVRETIRTFKAVEHRIEYVRTVDGVDYYNDSKGTNPDAAIKGIQAMVKPTILIGGGFDKKSSYDEWIRSFDGKVRYLLLMGQTASDIADCARSNGFNDIIFVNDMEEAVRTAREKSCPGDAVLLSPACASWGMFKNYEERGDIFKKLVREL